MKKVSIYELKQDLSSIIAEAEHGTEVEITRHNKPVARLVMPRKEHLHSGSRSGRSDLKPAVRGKTGGRYLQFLKEDRSSGPR
jgi:prevent-host-death family protein